MSDRSSERQCPDGGKCHHECNVGCWRVANAGPLSGVYVDDEWPASVVPVEPDYYEVETDGTSLSGPRFRVVTERPEGRPIYGYSPEPLERYAVYRVRLTDEVSHDE